MVAALSVGTMICAGATSWRIKIGGYAYEGEICIANAPYTKATGTLGAGGIGGYVKKKFKVEVMFITSSKVICRVVDGFKGKDKRQESLEDIEEVREEKMNESNIGM